MKKPTRKEMILTHLYRNPYSTILEVATMLGRSSESARIYLNQLKHEGVVVSRTPRSRCGEFRLSDREFHRRTSLEVQDSLMGCPLCALERKTRWWHEDDICVVCDCLTCGDPMIVLKGHATEPTPKEEKHMRRVVACLGMIVAREVMRQIPDHCHWHLKLGGEGG